MCIGIAKHFVAVSSLTTSDTFPLLFHRSILLIIVIRDIVSQMPDTKISSSETNACLQFGHLVFSVKAFHIHKAVIITINIVSTIVTFHFLGNDLIYCIGNSFSGFRIYFVIIFPDTKLCQWTTCIFYKSYNSCFIKTFASTLSDNALGITAKFKKLNGET